MSDPTNPFASPSAPPVIPTAGVAGYPDRIDYMRSYNYIFENPNWMMNVLFGSLCILSTSVIPIVGQLVFTGYLYDVIEALYLTRGMRYPDFDFNRFGDYLGRGLWPFLVSLLIGIPLVIVTYVGIFIVVLLGAAGNAIGGDNLGPVLAVLFGGIGFLGLTAFFFLVAGVVTPMVFRAGLQQDFAAAFDFGWAIDFLKKIWVEMVLVILFVMASAMILLPLGLFALCVGVYAAATILSLAHSHLCYQLYLVYLGRGGKPIPIKPAAMMAPAMPPASPPKY